MFVITTAKLGGYLSLIPGQPTVLGELLSGLILEPTVMKIFHCALFTDEQLGYGFTHLAEIEVLFIGFIAGLNLHLKDWEN